MVRFSVKKPYTVVVAVVMMILLGIIAFTRMTADLLPDMELPYALVMTPYPGAAPEQVEEKVSVPVEEAMATINNVEKVSSISSENYSLVILEFAESTNMDAASLDMREKLDQMKAGFTEESIGSPMIMKINPNMLPIMIAGVRSDQIKDPGQLTKFVNKEILPSLQSVEGVASVSASGQLTDRMEIRLEEKKIDLVNGKIRRALDGKFAEGEDKIRDSQKELDAGRRKLEEAQGELETGKETAADQLGQAQAQLTGKQAELMSTKAELTMQLALARQGLSALEAAKKELESRKDTLLAEGRREMEELEGQVGDLEDQIGQLETAVSQLKEAKLGLAELRQAKSQLEDQIQKGEIEGADPSLLAEMKSRLGQLEDQISSLESGLSQLGLTAFTDGEIDQQILQLESQIAMAKAAKEGLEETVRNGGQAVTSGIEEGLESGLEEADKGIEKVEGVVSQLEEALLQIETGELTLNQALSQLNAKGMLGVVEMAVGESKISQALGQLELGQKQLDAGKKELEGKKEEAYDQADARRIVSKEFLENLLKAQSFSMPAGYVKEAGVEYLVRVGDKVKSQEDLGHMVLLDLQIDGLEAIRVEDVADVKLKDNGDEVYANLNGSPGIIFSMEKQTGTSTGNACKALKERFEKLEKAHKGLHFVTLMDQSVYIDQIVQSVLKNLALGAVLAILILLLFLQDLRPTFVIACSIPISITTCIVLMYFSGITLNVISLSGLALGVGMLVDNSIVVIENIYRLRKEGTSALQAAIEGAGQVGGAIIASTLTTVCVFLPIVFTSGLTRQLFVDMGLTIAYSLLASLLVAMTVVPAMAAGVLREEKERRFHLVERIQEVYGIAIEICLRHRFLVLLGSLAVFIVSIMLAVSNGTALLPKMGSSQASVKIVVDKEKSLKELGAISDEVTKEILEIPGVLDVGTMAGDLGGSTDMRRIMSGASGNHTASMYVILDEKKHIDGQWLEKEIMKKTKGLDAEVEVDASSMNMSGLMASGISVRLEGNDLDKLRETAGKVKKLLERTEGTKDVKDGIGETTPELRIRVDREKAMEYGLTTAQVYAQVAEKLAEAKSSITLTTVEAAYGVYVVNGVDEDLTRAQVRSLKIKGTDEEKKEVKVALSKIASFEDTESMNAVNREDQVRFVAVTAAIDEEHNIGKVSEVVKREMKQMKLPAGISWKMAGEDDSINEAFEQIGLMFLLAVIFMYLIMVAQFQSLLSPFIIMFTIPLAFTGGLLGLWMGGSELSVIALIGFVMLAGVIVNNGIVMVDYINQLRRTGMEKRQAIREAGRTRLRPILMTALTTILAMSTMIFSKEVGAAMSKPMAIVVSGGLIYGTLLTLFVVPCIYDLLQRVKSAKDI